MRRDRHHDAHTNTSILTVVTFLWTRHNSDLAQVGNEYAYVHLCLRESPAGIQAPTHGRSVIIIIIIIIIIINFLTFLKLRNLKMRTSGECL
jgi:hypothetical protein